VNNVAILIVAGLAVLVIAALVVWTTQRRRSAELRERFGPEYQRTVEAARDRLSAEKELREREQRVEALDIQPLEPAARDRYAERWREVQAMFVDDPGGAVDQADRLIGEVMRARGYPVGDFEQRAADISVNHPQVVDHYRTAHAIAVKRRSGEDATEQLRQAFVHYRALFADLLETPDANGTAMPASDAVTTEAAETDPAATAQARRADVVDSTGVTPPDTQASAPATLESEQRVDSTRSAR
jgi:predicted nucleic acid-binding protein